MHIASIKTDKILPGDEPDLYQLLATSLQAVQENTVILVTSKVVSICEGRYIKIGDIDKDELIARESERFLSRTKNKFNVTVTIARGIFGAGAGVDESNGNGYYILWPEDPQKSANAIRNYIREKFGLKNVGVVITDSKTTPLRWGVTGVSLAHTGFNALKDYIGTPDIFGRDFQFEKLNVADALATAGVLVMGEGSEQTPLAMITDIPTITFQESDPTEEELNALRITLDDDLYGEFLKNAPWEKGKGK
ncbi:putative folate metabolism gamma-glutamate ligase [soil metagenome]